MKTSLFLTLVVSSILFSCSPSPSPEAAMATESSEMKLDDLPDFVLQSYSDEKNAEIKRRKPKLSEVNEATPADPLKLPDWIDSKRYVAENVDAIKYEPVELVGALVRTYSDGTFDIYSVTNNIKSSSRPPVLSNRVVVA
jgi:hypothetical protein